MQLIAQWVLIFLFNSTWYIYLIAHRANNFVMQMQMPVFRFGAGYEYSQPAKKWRYAEAIKNLCAWYICILYTTKTTTHITMLCKYIHAFKLNLYCEAQKTGFELGLALIVFYTLRISSRERLSLFIMKSLWLYKKLYI